VTWFKALDGLMIEIMDFTVYWLSLDSWIV
jgi:hypothetical protein